ncbi:SLC13 family permease [Anaerorhabdus sp.]|uniref:SLC13 family permease n=1 Tax=Anaerorhabdus sp. TaxID=1872524 RepID=UPI002FCB54CA
MENSKSSTKRYLIIIVALLCMFGFRLLPAPEGLSASGMQVIGVFVGVLILWLTISIDWPSILMIGALALVPELKFNAILSGAYGNSTFVFLMYTFVVTYALSKTSFIKRTALAFITSKIASKGPWYFVTLYFASIIFIGCFISPTVLFFVYLPIVEEIYRLLKLEKGSKLASMLMMGTVIMCGISSGMTPIAHVFPLIALGLYQDMYGVAINYANFMTIAIPVGLICSALTIFAFKLILKPDMTALKNFDVKTMASIEGKVGFDEKIILAIFALVVALWVLPGLITPIITTGPIYTFFKWIDGFGTAMPPLIGLVLLCIIQYKGKALLSFSEAMSKGVSWPSLIMCASTLALGSAITNADIGLTTWLSASLTPMISSLSPIIMVLIFTLWAAIQTNLSSNMVTATVVTAAALAITASMTNVNIAGIVVNIGMMASYAFATPPAMPCVAIAASSGWTDTMNMMKYGFIVMILCVIVATFIGYPISTFIM